MARFRTFLGSLVISNTNARQAGVATATELLADPVLSKSVSDRVRALRLQGACALLLATSLFALWAVVAPIGGAIVAKGFVRSELNRKVIQHQEGGLVEQILVRDGQKVAAGAALVVIGDMRSVAGFDLLRAQRRAELLRKSRLEAESDMRDTFEVPDELTGTPTLREVLPRERKVFGARRGALNEQLAAMQSSAEAAKRQVDALADQIVSTEGALKLAREELSLNESLALQGFVQRTRVISLQRVVSEYEARIGQERSDMAEAQQRIEDLRLRIAQTRNGYRQQSVDELKDSVLKLHEIDERLRPSEDLADRQTVRAPVAGTVMGLRVGAVGTAVGPREPLMELVPDNEKLVIEAHIRTDDIEHVHQGGIAEVRLSAYNSRDTPHLPARIQFVAPDRVTDPNSGAAWYVANLQVDDKALTEYPELQLQTGMPAEVFIATEARSLLRYLLEPIDAFRQRALREP